MKIFELSAAIIVFLMHYAVTQNCIVKEDPWGFMFGVLATVSIVWVYRAFKREDA